MQVRKTTTRAQSTPQPVLPVRSMLFAASASGLALTPIAVLAGVLGAWRLCADLGWANHFFVGGGLLSRYQVWLAIAIGAQTSAGLLTRWAEIEMHSCSRLPVRLPRLLRLSKRSAPPVP